MVYQWIKNNLLHGLPQACVLCGQSTQEHALCPGCIQDLPRLTAASCYQCGLPVESPTAARLVCGQCQLNSPAYDRVISSFAYTQPVSQLVGKLKFHGQIQLARLFGELLARQVSTRSTRAQAVLPVPLHPDRLRQRGFNQALEIARPLTRALALPMMTDCIQRQRNTGPQSEQLPGQRESNIRGAFRLVHNPAYRRIAIVDDVMTSGHTVNEIAKLLRGAGVEQIEVWCVARAWRH